jgi:hypothetical protein
MRQTLHVDVLTTKEATVVEVEGTTYAQTYQGNLKASGYAKKHPNDEHDAEVGHALAMARALKELAESYERRAWDRINGSGETVFAYGGIVSKPHSVTYTGEFDQAWLNRVLGKGSVS